RARRQRATAVRIAATTAVRIAATTAVRIAATTNSSSTGARRTAAARGASSGRRPGAGPNAASANRRECAETKIETQAKARRWSATTHCAANRRADGRASGFGRQDERVGSGAGQSAAEDRRLDLHHQSRGDRRYAARRQYADRQSHSANAGRVLRFRGFQSQFSCQERVRQRPNKDQR